MKGILSRKACALHHRQQTADELTIIEHGSHVFLPYINKFSGKLLIFFLL